MDFISRQIQKRFKRALDRGKSILLLGPRQTGKTTLVNSLNTDLYINLAQLCPFKPENPKKALFYIRKSLNINYSAF